VLKLREFKVFGICTYVSAETTVVSGPDFDPEIGSGADAYGGVFHGIDILSSEILEESADLASARVDLFERLDAASLHGTAPQG
jgi:hypothetical protein